ncbi:MAG TPA: CBS domain-containing protein [Methylomirabilota bacterium]|jgi:CBS domain-containing protein|nr:CBS domain-containing protein [Methylomirabilota bacterium]
MISHSDDDADDHGLDEHFDEIRGTFLNDTIASLEPAAPICLRETATAQEAIARMLERRQAGVLIVDDKGRLTGIFTERDVLTRVAGAGRDAARTALRDVMTPNPEALAVDDRIAYAVHSMSIAGYRTVPLVDRDRRPVGVATVSDVIRWLAHLFPEAVLNLPPGDRLKNPHAIDAG